jgi:Domain of unknown function (DUF4815)
MSTKLDLDKQPYFDDYKESDKYYQILFRPGRAVQARELTQLQTILQKQIERFGKHIFKNGSNVLPGTDNAVRYTPGITFIKLPLHQVVANAGTITKAELDAALQRWVGSIIGITLGSKSGIKAKIIGYRGPDNIVTTGGVTGEVRFFVNMLSASANGQYSQFEHGDTIQLIQFSDGEEPGTPPTATIPTYTPGRLKVGTVASVTVEEGVYFYNGYFVYVDGQTIFLAPVDATGTSPDDVSMQDKWGNLPTTSVGFSVTESTKTSQDDPDLLDNALGTSNYSAPGADRLHISADLVQINYDPTASKPDNFISLLDVSNGTLYSLASSPEYGPLMDTMARRTYDESGDYVTEDLGIEITEFLRDEDYKTTGAHDIREFQFLTVGGAKAESMSKFGLASPGEGVEYPTGSGIYYPGSSYDNETDATSFKNLCRKFLTARINPGKAYVKGYEIRKLAKTNVDIPKSRTTRHVENETVFTPVGKYFEVTDLVGNTAFTKYVSVDLYNVRRSATQSVVPTSTIKASYTYSSTVPNAANKIGTATLIKIEVDGAQGSGFYKAYVTDIKMTGGNNVESVKCISAPEQGLLAHTVLIPYDLAGAVTIPASIPSSQTSANFQLTGSAATGWFSVPGQILKQNDYIYVEETEELYRVVSSPTNNGLLSVSLASESAGSTVKSVTSPSKISGTYASVRTDVPSGLIYSLNENYISQFRGKTASGTTSTTPKIAYSIDTVFAGSNADGESPVAGVVTLNLATDSFEGNIFQYKIVKNVSGTKTSLNPASGTSAPSSAGNVNIKATYTLGQIKQLDFYFHPTDLAGGAKFIIVCPVLKVDVPEKTKVLRYCFYDPSSGNFRHTGNGTSGVPPVDSYGTGVVVAEATNNSEIHLNRTDVLRINRIVASKDAQTEPSSKKTLNDGDVDVTALYAFDNGQTDYEYGYAKVYLRPNYPKPSGKVRVEFDYFEHIGSGDYFCVNSYLGSIPYDSIPLYNSSDGVSYHLADCLDFRKNVDASVSGTPPIEFLTCDYFTYNERRDKIVLNSKTKNFELLTGIPGKDPEVPDDDPYSMTLAELTQTPYGVNARSCVMKPKDNRRYTMRDIGKLEKRIQNLEYYTSLSLLERETSNLRITDANGNDKFKNGFLVDNFKTFDSSDTESLDFSCSIDTAEGLARPLASATQFNLVEDISNSIFINTQDVLRNPSGDTFGAGTAYTKAGDLFMLPYKCVEFISQRFASKVVNVNPYAVFTYAGNINLNPWSDTWKEENFTTLPVVYDDSAYQQARSLFNGTIDYQDIWSSQTEKRGVIKRTGRVKLLRAGHALLEKLTPLERAQALASKFYVVPNNGMYTNPGERIPIGVQGVWQRQTAQTRTVTTKRLRVGLEQEVQKTGVTTSEAITKDELRNIEIMRPIDITVTGQSFRPNTNLYAYFDGFNVSNSCRPILPEDSTNYYELVDVTTQPIWPEIDGSLPPTTPLVDPPIPDRFKYERPALKSDSLVRYFKLANSDRGAAQFPVPTAGSSSTRGKVRPGCEVVHVSGTGIVRKFDIVEVIYQPTNNANWCVPSTIVVREKAPKGYVSSDIRPVTGSTGATFTASISLCAYGDQITADGTGSAACVFRVGGQGEASILGNLGGATGGGFKTGTNRFVLSSSNAGPAGGSGISRAAADFTAKGTLHLQEKTITQTQQFVVSSSLNVETDVDKDRLPNIYDYEPPEVFDPIAQTFRVRETGGCFITDVDVFFAKKPTQPIDVKLEIRTVSLTGQPEASIVGGKLGTVIKKAYEVVTNKVTVDRTTLANNKLKVEVDTDVAVIGVPSAELPNKLFGAVSVTAPGSSTAAIKWNSSSRIKSDSIKTSGSGEVTANEEFYTADMAGSMIPTRFTFASPIYLEEGKSYCFVLLSDSDEYEVWVAQRGPYGPLDQNSTSGGYGYYESVGETNVKIGTTESLDNQGLYVDGDFFKSKNGVAWMLDPSVSIKFNLWKANFSTRANQNEGNVVFVNETINWTDIPSNGLECRPGSNQIRVVCVNHGVSVGDRVRFTFNILPDDNGRIRGFNKTALEDSSGLRVVNTETDFFTVEVDTPAGATSNIGYVAESSLAKEQYRFGEASTTTNGGQLPGARMRVSKKYHSLLFNPNVFCPKGTSIEWSIQTRPTAGVNEYDSSGTLVQRGVDKSKLSAITIAPGVPTEFDVPMLLASTEQEPALGATWTRADLQSAKSVLLRGRLISDNSNLSPVLDNSRMAATVVSTRLDNPRGIAGQIGNVINNTTFDTLTIFDKGEVPSDVLLVTSSGTTSQQATPRTPSVTGTINSKVSFSTATQTLSGTFKQEAPNSKTLIGTSSSLLGNVFPGDTISATINNEVQRRVVSKVSSDTKLILESPFYPSLADGSTLFLVDDYMTVSTTDDAVAAHLSQLDVGKYASIALYEYEESKTETLSVTAASKSFTTNRTIKTITSVTSGSGATLTSYANTTYTVSGNTVTFNSSVASVPTSVTVQYVTDTINGTVASATGTWTKASDTKSFDNKLILGVEYTPLSAAGETKCKITFDHFNTSSSTSIPNTKYITISQLDRYIDEIASEGGSAGSRYLSKTLNLDRASNALKLSFDAVRDEHSEIDLYYRVEKANGAVAIYDENWIKATYNIDVDGVLTIKTPEPSDSVYKTYESTINGLQPFTSAQAKIVFRGGNPARPPRVKNLTLIALDE